MEKMKTFWLWYKQTAVLVGIPILFLVLVSALTRSFFTASCVTIGWRCEYALGTSQMAQAYLSDLVGGTADVTVTPRQKK